MSQSQSPNDPTYAQTAVGLGYATPAQVEECLRIQAEIRALGLEEPLGEILVRKGYVTLPRHKEILKKLGIHTDPIPGYTLQARIGKGGMGSVYRAVQQSVTRTVAVKILAPGILTDETSVERFFREARAAGKLSHKNLIAGIDVGEAGGLYYFVMEHVTGKSCRERLNIDGPFDAARVLDVAVQMAEALEYIHGHNLVHRDIKPENILITTDGTVKLCDLGLAKSTDSAAPSLTQEGLAVGTPFFMSPEQIRGEKDIDIRADLYSLGATLYYLASGRHPYDGKSAADVMSMHLKAPVPDPRAAAPGLGEDLARVLRKLMAKECAQRYALPAELLEDLKKISLGVPIPWPVDRPNTARFVPSYKPHSSHRAPVQAGGARWAAGVGGAVAAAAAVLAAWIVLGGRSGPPPAPRPVAARPATPARAEPRAPALPPPPAREERPPKELEARRAELAELDREILGHRQKEEFRNAALILEAARLRHGETEWKQAVDRKALELRAEADRLFPPLRQKAVEAQGRGAVREVRDLLDRVAKWGFSDLRADLDNALAAVPPEPPPPQAKPAIPAPPPPSEPQMYAALWEAAARLAGDRDYAEAGRVLDKTAGILQDPVLRAELAADREMLRAVEAWIPAALQTLAKSPRGQRLSVEFLDEEGLPRTIEESVVRADPFRVEFKREEGNLVVDLGEILAGSIAGLARTRSPKVPAKDARAAALFCLLGGDPEAARKEGGPALPEKYWTLGGKLADERANPDPRFARRESEARKLYYAAEQEFPDPAAASEAVRKYRLLLQDFAATSFVRRNRASLANRAEGGREFVFLPDDFRATGTFKLSRMPKGEPCWTSDADTDASRRPENALEIAFSVLPDTEYRCWVYAGGCCMETLGFHLQAADAPDLSGAPVQPVKQGIVTATRTHASHGGAKGPSRWGWVAIPLPKYASSGPRQARFQTDQKGFSVAWAVVSSARTAPPREAEVKEFVRAKGDAIRRENPADPALVGWWKLDETSGTTAADSSRYRNHGTLLKGAAWAAGKLDGALSLDGVDDHVRVPDSPSLNSPAAQLTLAAWVHRGSNHDNYRLLVSKQKGDGDLNHFFLGFDDNQYGFSVTTSRGMVELTGPQAPNGEWFHMAGTFDGKMLRLYVNGAEAASMAHGGALEPESRPVIIGGDQYDTKGSVQEVPRAIVDDVRIYSRALSPAEIAALAAPRPR